MKTFKQFLIEREEEQKKKLIFKETDGRSAFPGNTISAIERAITSSAKDLEKDWKNPAELVNAAFEELDVPIPQAYLAERWKQYTELLSHAVDELYKARGKSALGN
jgi:hypothetical protein